MRRSRDAVVHRVSHRHDLWIAATALNFWLPLVSNNKKHFARVPGLDLRGY